MIKNWLSEVWMIYWSLIKIMVPILFIVRFIELMGWVEYLADFIAPLMSWVGLPGEMGLVWMTAILGNIYTGMAVYYQLGADSLTIAQVSVLGTLILVAHALIMEVTIAKATGVSAIFTILLRLVGAFILGIILHQTYQAFNYLQEPVVLTWQPELADKSWQAWFITQVQTLAFALIIIMVLTLVIRGLRYFGIEKFIHWLLSPLLKIIGISKQASNFMIVGLTLGISFGGGLLIREAKLGTISGKDVFLTMAFLSLCHSLIEDTLLVMLIGADLSAILWGRFFFSLLMIFIIVQLLKRLPERQHRWLYVDFKSSVQTKE